MINEVKNIELLAPAKNLESARMAILSGADAIYIGGPQFSARAAAGNSWEEIEELVKLAHQYYVKIYLALNTIFFDEETSAVKEAVNKAYEIGVDALIIQDMGIMEMDLPPIPLIASTQTHNYDLEQIQFLEKAGFSRVILARELSLEQIKKIRQETKVDLEVFVHGALCVSFSGRCYFSQALMGGSANRGKCMQACRLPFSLVDDTGRELARDKFLLSLKDLNLSSSLQELIDAGITSFKIEGRLKDEIYVGNVVAKYRQELDKIIEQSQGTYKRASSGTTKLNFEPDLEKTFNRGYTNYFFHGTPFFRKDSKHNAMISLHSQKSLGKFIGKVKESKKDHFTLDRRHDLKNADGLCWFDAKNELTGVNINVVDRDRIFPAKWVTLKPGTDIYRNSDAAFEKKVQNGAERHVAVDFIVKEAEKGFAVKATDEDENSAEMEYVFEKKPAQNPEIVEKSWKQQLSKLGDTVFRAREFSFDFKQPYFIPLSVLNQWRRELIAELSKIRTKNYPKVSVKHEKTQNPYPVKELDYSFNVSNELAREFYQRHGAKVLENACELQTMRDKPSSKTLHFCNQKLVLMTTKHCLRYFLGACPSDLPRLAPKNPLLEEKPKPKEPLFLVYNNRKFRLTFNCAKCEMEIWE